MITFLAILCYRQHAISKALFIDSRYCSLATGSLALQLIDFLIYRGGQNYGEISRILRQILAMAPKLLVFGGTGFLGKRICEEAVYRGFEVVSISRSGKPPALLETPSRHKKWVSEVRWESADVLNPSTYLEHLRGTSNVIHSLGILLEDEGYKRKLQKTGFPNISFCNFPWWLHSIGYNPLTKKNPNFTYEVMNKQSAIALARAFAESIGHEINENSIPTFVYISADRGFPMIPEGYINSKRQAEKELSHFKDIFRTIIMRPGFLFDEMKGAKNARTYIHHLLEFLNVSNEVVLGKSFECMNKIIRPTVSTQQVSRCVLSKIADPQFKGIVPLETIKKY